MHKILRYFTKYILVSISIIILFLLGFVILINANYLTIVNLFIIKNHLLLTFWRITLEILTVLFYPKIIKLIIKDNEGIDQGRLEKIQKRRYIILFFIIFELFVAHNFLSVLVNYIIYG